MLMLPCMRFDSRFDNRRLDSGFDYRRFDSRLDNRRFDSGFDNRFSNRFDNHRFDRRLNNRFGIASIDWLRDFEITTGRRSAPSSSFWWLSILLLIWIRGSTVFDSILLWLVVSRSRETKYLWKKPKHLSKTVSWWWWSADSLNVNLELFLTDWYIAPKSLIR